MPKRILDIVTALSGIIISAVPMLLCAFAIRICGGEGPVLFRQKRIGADKHSFVCYKFRTMKTDTPPECATAKLEHPEKYITGIGKFLRRTSFDELPQLFNVLKGDMSLIGPRPVIAAESELIGLRDSLGVYEIRPGITGLAQVMGRDSLSIKRKAAYDAQYAERMSFAYDTALLIKTFFNVLFCRNVREGKSNG